MSDSWIPLSVATDRALKRSDDTRIELGDFDLSDVTEALRPVLNPLLAGVYFLFLGDELRYIGKTTNLAMRLVAHAATKKFDRVLLLPVDVATDAAAITGGRDSRLEQIESAFIRHFQPPENMRSNGTPHAMRVDVEATLTGLRRGEHATR